MGCGFFAGGLAARGGSGRGGGCRGGAVGAAGCGGNVAITGGRPGLDRIIAGVALLVGLHVDFAGGGIVGGVPALEIDAHEFAISLFLADRQPERAHVEALRGPGVTDGAPQSVGAGGGGADHDTVLEEGVGDLLVVTVGVGHLLGASLAQGRIVGIGGAENLIIAR